MSTDQNNVIQFDLVSPEEKLFSEAVKMVVVPGEEGDFGVLEGHTPIVSTLRNGVIRVYHSSMDDVPSKIFVSGGFADVSSTQCTILAEQAVNVADLVEADIDASIETLSGELEAAETQGAKRRIEAALNVAYAKKQALAA